MLGPGLRDHLQLDIGGRIRQPARLPFAAHIRPREIALHGLHLRKGQGEQPLARQRRQLTVRQARELDARNRRGTRGHGVGVEGREARAVVPRGAGDADGGLDQRIVEKPRDLQRVHRGARLHADQVLNGGLDDGPVGHTRRHAEAQRLPRRQGDGVRDPASP